MFSAIFSFLGGSAFRLIWEQISQWLTARQDHAQELERIRLQAEIDAQQHARNLEAIKVQADLGVQTIRVQGDHSIAQSEMDAWAGAVANAAKPSGIWIVDAWNGTIRPAAASISLLLWVVALNANGWKMTDWDRELVGVILGFFFATRSLIKK